MSAPSPESSADAALAVLERPDDGVAVIRLNRPQAANALSLDNEGWALLAPYGDSQYPIPDGKGGHTTVIQRITKASAQTMVDTWNSTLSRVKRSFASVSFFSTASIARSPAVIRSPTRKRKKRCVQRRGKRICTLVSSISILCGAHSMQSRSSAGAVASRRSTCWW